MEIRAKTDIAKTRLDIEAAIEAVKSAGKVGIVGYCWGGTLTYDAAVNLPGLAAASSYYGGGVPAMADQKRKFRRSAISARRITLFPWKPWKR